MKQMQIENAICDHCSAGIMRYVYDDHKGKWFHVVQGSVNCLASTVAEPKVGANESEGGDAQ